MKKSIDGRLARLEARAGLSTISWPPAFRYIDDPTKPDDTERGRREAEEHQRKYPGALIICHQIFDPETVIRKDAVALP
jgi:hypothetical protein